MSKLDDADGDFDGQRAVYDRVHAEALAKGFLGTDAIDIADDATEHVCEQGEEADVFGADSETGAS